MSNQPKVSEVITNKIKARILSLMEEKPEAEKQPSNAGLTLAWLAFNAIYLFLDIGTAVMVANLTSPFYGVAVFFAGITPFMIYEALFLRAYNSPLQRKLTIGGAGVSIASTIILALLVGILNSISFFNMQLAAWVPVALEWTLIIGSVAAVGVHGLVWIVYYFSDNGIRDLQVRTETQAKQAQRRDKMAFAKQDVTDFLEMAKEVDEYERNNVLEALAMALDKYGLKIDTSSQDKQGQQNNQPRQQQQAFAQEVKTPQLSDNHREQQDFIDRQSQNK